MAKNNKNGNGKKKTVKREIDVFRIRKDFMPNNFDKHKVVEDFFKYVRTVCKSGRVEETDQCLTFWETIDD